MSDGYLFVPLPDHVNRRRRLEAVFDRQVDAALSGVATIEFVCEQPIHIGSGFKRVIGPRVVRSAVRIHDGLGLPGSSVKGMIRSRYEAITYSCTSAPKVPKGKGDLWEVKSSTGIKYARFRNGLFRTEVFRACSSDEMCPACALFGRMSQRSRVTVTDFHAPAQGEFALFDLPEQFGPNIHHVGAAKIIADEHSRDRSSNQMFEVSDLKGRKFALGEGRRVENAKPQPVEVIPAGTILQGQIRFMNVMPMELGGILAAIGKVPASKLKIGAGKCYGLGRMSLRTMTFALRGRSASATDEQERAWRAAFEAAQSDRFPVGEDTLVRIHQGAC